MLKSSSSFMVSLILNHLSHQTPMIALLQILRLHLFLQSQKHLNLWKAQSSAFAYSQHTFQDFPNPVAESVRNPQRLCHDGVKQSFLIFTHPRQLSREKFIKDDTYRPNVTLPCIVDSLQHLRSHVIRRPNMRSQKLTTLLQFRHSKICQLQAAVLEKNVCWLQIPMNYPHPNEFSIPVKDLPEILASQVLTYGAIFGKSSQITVAQLHNDINVISFLNYLEQFHDVVVIELSQNFNFVVNDGCDGSVMGKLGWQPYLFDGIGRVLVNLSEASSSDRCGQLVLSSSYSLGHLYQQSIIIQIAY